MRKVFLSLLGIAILCSLNVSLCLAETQKNVMNQRAVQTMTDFIANNQLTDSSWDNVKITNTDYLYDANLNNLGYVFELDCNDGVGYGIVVDTGTDYVVVEASQNTPSPYLEFAEGFKKVYTTALNYYVYDEQTRSNSLIDVRDGSHVNPDELRVKRMDTDSFLFGNSSATKSTRSTSSFLNNYAWQFIHITQQPNTSACIPASFAMALRYLDNIGKVNLTYSGTNADMKESLYNAMRNYGSGPAVTDRTAQSGIKSWTEENCSDCYFQICIDTFYPTAAEYADVTAEIDDDFPVIIMFYDGVLVSGADHATCMFGYRVDNGTNYVIVSDPWETVGGTKTVAWNTSNVYGYFILYRYSK